MGKRLEDGSWKDACLDKLRPGEPFFVLRAQDKFAPLLVDLWAELAGEHGCPTDKVHEAFNTADQMRSWPIRKYPD